MGIAGCTEDASMVGPELAAPEGIAAAPTDAPALRITRSESVVAPGDFSRLRAVDASGSTVSSSNLDWQSARPGIATVSSSGIVKGVSPGTTVIAAVGDGAVALHSVVVVGGGSSAVRVRPLGTSRLDPGDAIDLEVTDTRGRSVSASAVSWSTSASSIISVSGSGRLTAVAPGWAVVTVRRNGFVAQHGVVVTGKSTSKPSPDPTPDPDPEPGPDPEAGVVGNLKFTQAESVLGRGDFGRLAVVDRSGERVPASELTWSSGASSIASVSPGRVKGESAGVVVIVARRGNDVAHHSAVVWGGGSAALRMRPTQTVLAAGETSQLNPTDPSGNPVDPSSVTWSSGNRSVATVSSSGRVRGRGPGFAVITGRRNGFILQHSVAVTGEGESSPDPTPDPEPDPTPDPSPDPDPTPGVVGNLKITRGESVLGRGDVTRLTVVDRNGTRVSDSELTWSSGATGIATVSAGLVRGEGPGVAVIQARRGNDVAHHSAVVVGGGSATLRMSPLQTVLAAGEVRQLKPTDPSRNPIDPSSVSWSSTDPSVASVSGSGRITGQAPGVVIITGRRNGFTLQHSVAVTGDAVLRTVDRIELSPGSSALEGGRSIQLVATALNSSGTPVSATFNWSSNRPAVARVSSSGLVTAAAPGEATIRVSVNGVSATHEVSVIEATAPLPPPSGGWNEPGDFVTAVDERWNSFSDRGWYRGTHNEGRVGLSNGKLVWTYTEGMGGGYTPSGPVVLEYRHGPYQYHRDEGVVLSPNFHGHSSGVNKFRFWSTRSPQATLGFFGADNSNLYIGINTNGWAMGARKMRWNSPDNRASPTRNQAEVVRGRPHNIETLTYIGSAGGANGWVKVWLDGVLILDFENLAIVPAGERVRWSQIHFAPVWGGLGDVVPADQTMSVDRTYVSVRR